MIRKPPTTSLIRLYSTAMMTFPKVPATTSTAPPSAAPRRSCGASNVKSVNPMESMKLSMLPTAPTEFAAPHSSTIATSRIRNIDR